MSFRGENYGLSSSTQEIKVYFSYQEKIHKVYCIESLICLKFNAMSTCTYLSGRLSF